MGKNTTLQKEPKYSGTFLLFSMPGFLDGIGAIFDFPGSLLRFNESPTPEEADARALASDWAMVGADIRSACDEFEKK